MYQNFYDWRCSSVSIGLSQDNIFLGRKALGQGQLQQWPLSESWWEGGVPPPLCYIQPDNVLDLKLLWERWEKEISHHVGDREKPLPVPRTSRQVVVSAVHWMLKLPIWLLSLDKNKYMKSSSQKMNYGLIWFYHYMIFHWVWVNCGKNFFDWINKWIMNVVQCTVDPRWHLLGIYRGFYL